MIKTIKEWLQEIPDPEIRAAALKNMYKDYQNEWSRGLPEALSRAFLFRRSPEGFDYWSNVHQALCGRSAAAVIPMGV